MLEHYHVNLLILLSLSLYLVGLLGARKHWWSLIAHRRFWNYLLLISFLASGLSGLLLAAVIDYGRFLSWHRTAIWLHVETGIVMAASSIFHTLWHRRYFFRPKERASENR